MGKKFVKPSEVFTAANIEAAKRILAGPHVSYADRNAKLREVLQPRMVEINAITGQENDVGYMAHMLEYCVTTQKL